MCCLVIDRNGIPAVPLVNFRFREFFYFRHGRVGFMAIAPHRGLRVVLGSMSLLAAVVGLLMIFGGKLLVTKLFMHPPESEISTLLLFTMKEVGGFAFMLSFMLFFAYRDPVRNVAIIDSLIVGLCVLALTPLLSMYTPDIRRLYPGYLI